MAPHTPKNPALPHSTDPTHSHFSDYSDFNMITVVGLLSLLCVAIVITAYFWVKSLSHALYGYGRDNLDSDDESLAPSKSPYSRLIANLEEGSDRDDHSVYSQPSPESYLAFVARSPPPAMEVPSFLDLMGGEEVTGYDHKRDRQERTGKEELSVDDGNKTIRAHGKRLRSSGRDYGM